MSIIRTEKTTVSEIHTLAMSKLATACAVLEQWAYSRSDFNPLLLDDVVAVLRGIKAEFDLVTRMLPDDEIEISFHEKATQSIPRRAS